jgi:hypothetical protein
MRLLTIIIASGCLVGGCRLARAGGETPEAGGIQPATTSRGSSSTPGGEQSKPIGGGVILPLNFDDDGRIREHLCLRLDYFPPPRPDAVSIASCRSDITESTVVGRIVCDSDQSLAVDLTADQIKQQCYTASPPVVREPTRAMQLPGCKGSATLKITERSPNLKIEILN